MNPSSLPVQQRIALVVQALDGAEKTNKALATCADGDAMVDILLGASAKLGLGLTRRDLTETPPIRDWIWFQEQPTPDHHWEVGPGTKLGPLLN